MDMKYGSLDVMVQYGFRWICICNCGAYIPLIREKVAKGKGSGMSNADEYGRQCLERVNNTPIEVELFFDLLREAQKAMRGKRRELPPDAERCFEDAPPDVIYARDSPMNQLAFAIIGDCQKLFPNDC